jgi:hypothetical protein
MNVFGRLGVRIVRATTVVDRGQRLFDRVRSTLVARFASDEFLEAYNDVAYRKHADYAVDSARFRAGLFHWEEEMAGRNFPPPPCRLLIGGAGGGREVYAWASQGYEIVAFEPSPTLARSIARQATLHPGTQAWMGRYEDLPLLADINSGAPTDVTTLGPFAAVVLGWPTYSHIRRRESRVSALRRLAALTDGPVALSFFLDKQRDLRATGRLQRLATRLGITRTGDTFSPHIGFHHWSTEDEICAEIREAGLEVLDFSYDDRDGRWPWIVARRGRAATAAVSP